VDIDQEAPALAAGEASLIQKENLQRSNRGATDFNPLEMPN
jgi:hypothetical protein